MEGWLRSQLCQCSWSSVLQHLIWVGGHGYWWKGYQQSQTQHAIGGSSPCPRPHGMSSQEQQEMVPEKGLEARHYTDPEPIQEIGLETSYNLCPRDSCKKLVVYSTRPSPIWDARPERGSEMRLQWGSKGSIQETGLEKGIPTTLLK